MQIKVPAPIQWSKCIVELKQPSLSGSGKRSIQRLDSRYPVCPRVMDTIADRMQIAIAIPDNMQRRD